MFCVLFIFQTRSNIRKIFYQYLPKKSTYIINYKIDLFYSVSLHFCKARVPVRATSTILTLLNIPIKS